MTERVGCIWFKVDESLTDQEIEDKALAFMEIHKDSFPGGNYYLLDSRETARKLIEKMAKALKMSKFLRFKKDGELILDKDEVPIN